MADLLKKLNLNGTEYELGMSSVERAKLEGIESGAQVNKLEGVQVDGTDLSISGKKVNIDLANPIKNAVDAAKGELNGTINGIDGRLQTVEGAYETKANVATAKQEAIAAGALTISEAAGTGNVLKTYTFTQNGAEVGTINLAKDLVVSGGKIVVKDGEKYLSLTIANQEAPVEIPVKDLVDVYEGSTYITVGSDNKIELKFADLDAALVAESAQVGAKLKANAEAAAAADAKGAQGIADAAAAKAVADANAGRLDAIEADYLKAADKSELQGNIDKKVDQTAYDEKVAALEAKDTEILDMLAWVEL